jgi:hypothetical protein
MDIATIHGYIIGFVIIASWAIVCGWSLALRFTRYTDTPTFWRAVSVAQILLALQLLIGLVQFGVGRLPGDGSAFDVSFHVLYGVVFPLIALAVGHGFARSGRFSPYAVFAVVGLVNFGLTARAWQVAIGMS